MTRATIPVWRKHIYVYLLLASVPLMIGAYWPRLSPKARDRDQSRADVANKLADTLFP